MSTEEIAGRLPPTVGWRRSYLFAVAIGWFFVDVFDGLFVPDESPEHWLEAGWWAAATVVYLVLAWRRPLAAEQRPIDWIAVACMAMFGVAMVLRATLPDAIAFRWAVGMMAVVVAVTWLMVRRSRRTGVPANG